jgi:hypothetical protein
MNWCRSSRRLCVSEASADGSSASNAAGAAVSSSGGRRFRCRDCRRVRYASQSETKADRASRAMFKIVKRLDPEEECNDLSGDHWQRWDNDGRGEKGMARKRYTTEQIIGLLREAEVRLSQGQTIGTVCRSVGGKG